MRKIVWLANRISFFLHFKMTAKKVNGDIKTTVLAIPIQKLLENPDQNLNHDPNHHNGHDTADDFPCIH
jgi:hypothetical protein